MATQSQAPKTGVRARKKIKKNVAEGIVRSRRLLLPEAEDHVIDGIGSKGDRKHSERDEEPSIAKRKHPLDRHDNLPSAWDESSPSAVGVR